MFDVSNSINSDKFVLPLTLLLPSSQVLPIQAARLPFPIVKTMPILPFDAYKYAHVPPPQRLCVPPPSVYTPVKEILTPPPETLKVFSLSTGIAFGICPSSQSIVLQVACPAANRYFSSTTFGGSSSPLQPVKSKLNDITIANIPRIK